MKIDDPEAIQLELKVLRTLWGAVVAVAGGAGDLLCAVRPEMLDLPSPRRVTSRPRLPGNHKIEAKSQPGDLSGFVGKGGAA